MEIKPVKFLPLEVAHSSLVVAGPPHTLDLSPPPKCMLCHHQVTCLVHFLSMRQTISPNGYLLTATIYVIYFFRTAGQKEPVSSTKPIFTRDKVSWGRNWIGNNAITVVHVDVLTSPICTCTYSGNQTS